MQGLRKLKCDDLIYSAQSEALVTLRRFLKHLDLDQNMFNHLFMIKSTVKKTNRKICAEYDPLNFVINIDESYLESMISYIDKNPSIRKQVILNLASTLVHEMIHAGRTIIIDDTTYVRSIKEDVDNEVKRKPQLDRGYNIDELDNALSLVAKKAKHFSKNM